MGSLKNLLVLFLLIGFSCGSTKKLYETFYVGKNGNQYFIKPLSYTSPQKKSLEIDFTFIDNDKSKDSVISNFTLSTKEIPITNVDSISFMIDNKNYTVSSINLIYKESVKGGFKSRFTCYTKIEKLKKYFSEGNNDREIITYSKASKDTFTPTGKANNRIQKLNQKLFVLIENN